MTSTALALLALLAASGSETPAEALTRGRLESDLGRHAVAAAAYLSVTRSPEALPRERWEALVRLGVARRESGDAAGAVSAFREAWTTYGDDPEARRFVLQGVGSALPADERWQRVWRDVRLDFAMAPGVRAVWPDADLRLCPCSGSPMDASYEDQDLQPIFASIADTSRLNVVVQPGSQGRVTYQARQRPWDEVLESILAPNGLVARRTGNVVWIGRSWEASPHRAFSGATIDVDFANSELTQALAEVAAKGGCDVRYPDGMRGRVWIKLEKVPWDQAFDLLANANGLDWSRDGRSLVLSPKPRPMREP